MIQIIDPTYHKIHKIKFKRLLGCTYLICIIRQQWRLYNYLTCAPCSGHEHTNIIQLGNIMILKKKSGS